MGGLAQRVRSNSAECQRQPRTREQGKENGRQAKDQLAQSQSRINLLKLEPESRSMGLLHDYPHAAADGTSSSAN